MVKAEQLVKVKNSCSSGEEKVKESEEAVEKAKKAAPEGDLSLEKADAIDEACATAMTLIRAVGNIVQPSVDRAPPKAKAELQKLLERRTAAQTACTEVVTSTKERREAAHSAHFLAEAETKTKAAETAATAMKESESPFLIGASQSSSKATLEVLDKCAEAGKACSVAANAAKSYAEQKLRDSRVFGEVSSKKVKEGVAGMQERLKKVSLRVVAFDKDSKDRIKGAKMVEAV